MPVPASFGLCLVGHEHGASLVNQAVAGGRGPKSARLVDARLRVLMLSLRIGGGWAAFVPLSGAGHRKPGGRVEHQCRRAGRPRQNGAGGAGPIGKAGDHGAICIGEVAVQGARDRPAKSQGIAAEPHRTTQGADRRPRSADEIERLSARPDRPRARGRPESVRQAARADHAAQRPAAGVRAPCSRPSRRRNPRSARRSCR